MEENLLMRILEKHTDAVGSLTRASMVSTLLFFVTKQWELKHNRCNVTFRMCKEEGALGVVANPQPILQEQVETEEEGLDLELAQTGNGSSMMTTM